MKTPTLSRGPAWRIGSALSVACAVLLHGVTGTASAAGSDQAAEKPADFSAAERALFMSDQLGTLRAPATLTYQFRKSGSLEPGFADSVTVKVTARPGGACCAVTGEFFTGARRLPMPDADEARGNPVIMYFLERDVREMQRLTKGQSNHFRKQIRMAIFEGATLRDVAITYQGKSVPGREIVITPYLTDPNRPRFAALATKRYVFTLSDAVPGGVFAMRTQVDPAAATGEPVLAEELLFSAADQKSTR
jgi:hypothetical protein